MKQAGEIHNLTTLYMYPCMNSNDAKHDNDNTVQQQEPSFICPIELESLEQMFPPMKGFRV